MIRVLILIAVAGFVLSLVALTGAISIGGPEAMSRGSWVIASDDDWHSHWRDEHHGRGWGAARTTRTFAWTGEDTFSIGAPAEIRYTQRPGPPTLTVTGSRRALERLEVDDGRIRFRGGYRPYRKLTIVLAAPNVTTFNLSGANQLTIDGYSQDRLSLDLSGASEVTASGQTRLLELEISGAGDADLSKLKTREAEVDISGAGDATVAPTDRAKLDISGMGSITLLTRPARLETDVSGAGSIHEAEPEAPQSRESSAGRAAT